MKLFAIVAATLLTTASASWEVTFNKDVSVSDVLDVPGDNPLSYCSAPSDSDVLEIQKVDISPNPPKA